MHKYCQKYVTLWFRKNFHYFFSLSFFFFLLSFNERNIFSFFCVLRKLLFVEYWCTDWKNSVCCVDGKKIFLNFFLTLFFSIYWRLMLFFVLLFIRLNSFFFFLNDWNVKNSNHSNLPYLIKMSQTWLLSTYTVRINNIRKANFQMINMW